MRFEWDDAKARSNFTKHRISFDVAAHVWNDPLHVILPDRIEDGEERWHAIGIVEAAMILVVVHIYPDETNDMYVRIIGARRATRHERTRYQEGA